MMLFLALLPQSQNLTLASTPEWKAYKRELAKHHTIKVDVEWSAPVGRDSDRFLRLVTKSNGDFDIHFESGEIKWAGNQGISIDSSAKTWSKVSDSKGLAPTGIILLGFLNRNEYPTTQRWNSAAKMTRAPYRPDRHKKEQSQSETGYRFHFYHTDAGSDITWWFDNKSHLLTEVQLQSLGPMAPTRLTGTVSITFAFDSAVDSKIDLSPPTGYAQTK